MLNTKPDNNSTAGYTFDVEVLLNTGLGWFDEFDPAGAALVRGVTLQVRAATARDACDVVYAIGNSYPGELLTGPWHAPQVQAYRAAGLRSLSVGDVVVVHTPDGPMPYACQRAGWRALPAVPDVPALTDCVECGQTVPGSTPSYQHDQRCSRFPRS